MSSMTTREALAQITRAVEALFAAGWLEGTPDTAADADAAMGQLRAAMIDAQAAMAVTEPLMLDHRELRHGDRLAFHLGRFDTISTLDDFARCAPQYLEWEPVHGTTSCLTFRNVTLRTDRTYVVRRPL